MASARTDVSVTQGRSDRFVSEVYRAKGGRRLANARRPVCTGRPRQTGNSEGPVEDSARTHTRADLGFLILVILSLLLLTLPMQEQYESSEDKCCYEASDR
jgi:hypothetical protein